ncbi:ethanolamine ammonia-lyase subunit EutC [Rhodococcus cercidiphylli]|jgi:ethanolamine ammonia-lyase small subunit|uniref:Ethanolamine ammonia-lyase small subunit n=1 Tax=Rhodococcus cercidiphylli TaxID=489916 RepID=A0ABU4AU89_9NOCA|nr:ethanolamine ammonia-lyase subunit EutC [Rhodococcus cercidiphylli]MDV6229810.1 ethanolamine ammonia-lyase subunit EutC [Rhodococcus cercidiphylli]
MSTPAERPETEFWGELRAMTQARIGLGRIGDSLPTTRVLEFRSAHAAARDAVHMPLEVEEFVGRVEQVGLGAPSVVTSLATSRAEYLRRPDLGRQPKDLSEVVNSESEIGIVLGDGLSPRALADHGVPMLEALKAELSDSYSIAAPVIATEARVALGDHIAAAMGVRTVLVLIGERPGLSVADSLGIYLTHLPRPGCTDADRNCVSNIHPPEGQGYAQSARIVAGLLAGARKLGRSGVALKDTSRADVLEAGEALTLE